jgi:predicted NUDIX family NTP pyrophosphohydrolase
LISSGTLLFRRGAAGVEVLIVRPGGFAAKYGWSIPKGLVDPGEDLETAARRETREETGVEAGPLAALGHVDYTKSKKRIHCFYGEAPAGSALRNVPDYEVAEARFVPLEEARRLLHRDQKAFIDMLAARVQTD